MITRFPSGLGFFHWLPLLFLATGLFSAPVTQAASEAVIVVGMSGDESDAEHLNGLAEKTGKLLGDRGIPKDKITVLGTAQQGKTSREKVLSAVKAAAGRLQPDDEFWLILFGHAGRSASGSPSFQLSGPRVTAEDLHDSLKDMKATQNVFVATEASGGFLRFLLSPRCNALAATTESGEINDPRYPDQWVEALAENPKAPMPALAARAAQKVEEQYEQLALVQGEHARLTDPQSGKILEPPFGITDLAKAMAPPPPAPKPDEVKPSDITTEVEDKTPGSQFSKVAATDETRSLINEAKAAANPEQFPAILLLQEASYTVNSDQTTSSKYFRRIYLTRDEAADEWANFRFGSSQAELTRITGGRTILPDGSSFVLDITKVKSAPSDDGYGGTSYQMIYFPNALAGCIIEIAYETSSQSASGLPAFYEELPLQQPIPALQTKVTLKLPIKGDFRYVLKNSDAAPKTSTTEHSKVLTWEVPNLPAHEALPLDPPQRESAVWLGVSSLVSWETFDAWFHRIAKGSEESDPTVAEKANELAHGKKTATEKIKGAFEFVSSLRYVAIEFGINAFRPRTPATVLKNRYGDCKDKANLLVALIREMKLPAHFVLINRGSSTDPQFPGWQFNHAIAYVPATPELGIKEPLWLDSTDTTTPFGTIAPGDAGRSARVYKGEHGVFETVTSGERTRITDNWTGEEGPNGEWQGTCDQQWTGLADDEKRKTIGSMGPAQRTLAFSQWLDAAMPGADFSGFQVSEAGNLTQPMRLQSKWKSMAISRWNPAIDFAEYLAATTRNRALVINDGQPMDYVRTVRLHFAASQKEAEKSIPASFDREVAGAKLSIQTRWLDERTLEQISTCSIQEPKIPAEQYAAFRSAFREWSSKASEAIPKEGAK